MKRYELLLPYRIAEFAADLAAGVIPADDVLFDIRSGDDFIGLTELELSGSGKCRVKTNQTRKLQLVWRTAKISKKDFIAFAKSFHRNAVWSLPSGRPGRPDERGIRVALRYRNRMWAQTFWLGELAGSKGWSSFHDTVQKTVNTIAARKLLDWAN